MGTLHTEIMTEAIKRANEQLVIYSDTDLKEFTFDRLVDEYYAEILLQRQAQFSCPGCGE